MLNKIIYTIIILLVISYGVVAFELPIKGSTGYASMEMNLKSLASEDSRTLSAIKPGTAFLIIEEKTNWWNVQIGNIRGWVKNDECFINLPDIIPSIIYYNTNSFSSVLRSSGKPIPNVTNKKLYHAYNYNERLKKTEYIMPVIYPMAFKIYRAQKMALENGDSLKIYEAFRPRATQRKIVQELNSMAKKDKEVMDGISRSPWSLNWFIATTTSNHQRGSAIDVSLVKVLKYSKDASKGYLKILNYSEYEMPTKIHELSYKSRVFELPVSSSSETQWKKSKISSTMTEGAKKLQYYCTEAGLTPLASEWWHFNDLKNTNKNILGEFYLDKNLSIFF